MITPTMPTHSRVPELTEVLRRTSSLLRPMITAIEPISPSSPLITISTASRVTPPGRRGRPDTELDDVMVGASGISARRTSGLAGVVIISSRPDSTECGVPPAAARARDGPSRATGGAGPEPWRSARGGVGQPVTQSMQSAQGGGQRPGPLLGQVPLVVQVELDPGQRRRRGQQPARGQIGVDVVQPAAERLLVHRTVQQRRVVLGQQQGDGRAVSYTHLTLPTKRIV